MDCDFLIVLAIGLICGAVFWETWRARIEPALREWHHHRRLRRAHRQGHKSLTIIHRI